MSGERVVETISRPVALDDIGDGGAHFRIETDQSERAAIAKRLNIPGLASLSGDFNLKRIRGGVEIDLELAAVAERVCVVSLEPMTEKIGEKIRMQLLRDYEDDAEDDGTEGDGVFREPLEGDTVDLGELLVQHLSLSLDPYPRKEGAMSLSGGVDPAAAASPFAVLKGLGREKGEK